MKKLAKVLLGAVMLSALFVGCNNGNGLVANDELAAPDVKGYATENGAIVLKWDVVKDATGYELYEMLPGTEEWQAFEGTTGSSPVNYAVFNKANRAASEYKFKVVAKCSKANVLQSSATEVSVETPEAFKDYVLDASKITIALQPGQPNIYDVSFPVDAGYKYDVKFINVPATNLSARTLFACNITDGNVVANSGSAQYVGAKYVTEKAKDSNGDEYLVSPVVDSITVNASTRLTAVEDYYAVIKATPVNEKVGKTVYAVSSATAKGIASNDADLENLTVTRTAASKVRVSFEPTKKNNAYPLADKFVVYRVLKTTEDGWSTIGAFEKLGTPTAYTKLRSTTKAPVYVYDDTIAAFDTTGKKTYAYKYYVIAEGNGDENSIWHADRNWIEPNGGVSNSGTPSVSISRVSKKDADPTKNTYQVTVTYANCTPTIVYKAFDTRAAAEAAVAEEVTTAAPAGEKTTTPTNWTFITTTDGVTTTNKSSSTIIPLGDGGAVSEVIDINLNPGVSRTTTTDSGAKTTTTVEETTGAYYVFRIYATKADGTLVVDTAMGYITKNKNGTSDATYSAVTTF